MLKTAQSVMIGLVLLLPAVGDGEDLPDPLRAAFAALRAYDWGPQRTALLPIDVAVIASHRDAAARDRLEASLLEVLSAGTPRAAKDYVCRQLQAIGTARSVPALGTLLSDPELAHMARAALEVIPGDEATAALRDALLRLTGELQIGVIHSLGRRGDTQAVSLLVELLGSTDLRVVGASVTALSNLPDPEAARAVLAFVDRSPAPVRRAADEAAMRIARRNLAEGKLQEAATIYRLYESNQAAQLRYAALQGLLEAEPERAVARWMTALSDDRAAWRRCVAQLVREHAVASQIEALCAEFPKMPPIAQVELLDALQTRCHPAIRSAALAAVAAEDPPLRLSAVRALASSGTADDVPVLATLAAQADSPVRDAAEQSLVHLDATGVDDAMLNLLGTAEPAARVALIRVLAARETPGTGPTFLRLAQSDADAVRMEALLALQSVADATMAEVLVTQLAHTPAGKQRDALERAVWKCCSQIAPTESQAQPVLAALAQADQSQRVALLPALGRIGGAESLSVIQQAMHDQDAAIQDAAIRGLCNWPDATVAGQLLELARSGPREAHRTWALRAYARVAARAGAEKPQEVFAGLREAMGLASRIEDKQLVLSRLTAVRCVDALAFVISLLDDEQLRSDAIDVAVSLAEGMKQSHPKEARTALEKVGTVTQDPELQTYIAKLLWNMQLKETQKTRAE